MLAEAKLGIIIRNTHRCYISLPFESKPKKEKLGPNR